MLGSIKAAQNMFVVWALPRTPLMSIEYPLLSMGGEESEEKKTERDGRERREKKEEKERKER